MAWTEFSHPKLRREVNVGKAGKLSLETSNASKEGPSTPYPYRSREEGEYADW
jgi:hypothetical protein